MYEHLNINKTTTVCFTGYRSSKLPWGYNEDDDRCKRMKHRLRVEIENSIQNGYNTFLCGMAIGFDMICAETVLTFKEQNNSIKLIGAIPCEDQDNYWSLNTKKRYRNLKEKLDGIRCLNEHYQGFECMLERNKFMVDNSSLLIALYDGLGGGTKFTIDYAIKKGLRIVQIEP